MDRNVVISPAHDFSKLNLANSQKLSEYSGKDS